MNSYFLAYLVLILMKSKTMKWHFNTISFKLIFEFALFHKITYDKNLIFLNKIIIHYFFVLCYTLFVKKRKIFSQKGGRGRRVEEVNITEILVANCFRNAYNK